LVIYLPWAPTMLEQLRSVRGGFWIAKPTAKSFFDSLCALSGFDSATFQALFRRMIYVPHLFGVLTWGPMVLLILVWCAVGGLTAVRAADRRKTVALLSFSMTPFPLVFLYSHISSSVYINRIFSGSGFLLPMLACVPIAFQAGRRRASAQFLGLVMIVLVAASTFGYLRREQKEDWRGVTAYLARDADTERLWVIVPDLAQVLVDHYARLLPNSYLRPAMTGLTTKFKPPNGFIGDPFNPDVTGILSNAIRSGRYREVDVAIQSNMPPITTPLYITPTLNYLAGHCRSIETVQFYLLDVERCVVR
jgi:hypothetical protein